MQNFDLGDLDLSDRGTQVMLAGAAILTGLVLSRLRGGGKPVGEDLSTIQFEWKSDPGGPAYNGTFPPSPPIFVPGPNDPADPDPADPDPVTPPPSNGTPLPADADQRWSCPVGYRLAWESTGSGNVVCRNVLTGREIQTRDKTTGQPTGNGTPAPATDDSMPYYCEAPSVLARESNGSGNHVCRWPDGRETRVIMRDTGRPYGVGGDGPDPASVRGLPTWGGFTPVPAALHAAEAVTARAGDTLKTIADRYLGNAERWPALTVVNPELRERPLRAGDVVRLP